MEYKFIFIIFIFVFVIANKYLFDKIKGDTKKLIILNNIELPIFMKTLELVQNKPKPKPKSLIWIIKNVYLEFMNGKAN